MQRRRRQRDLVQIWKKNFKKNYVYYFCNMRKFTPIINATDMNLHLL